MGKGMGANSIVLRFCHGDRRNLLFQEIAGQSLTPTEFRQPNVGIMNSAPRRPPVGQRCVKVLYRV